MFENKKKQRLKAYSREWARKLGRSKSPYSKRVKSPTSSMHDEWRFRSSRMSKMSNMMSQMSRNQPMAEQLTVSIGKKQNRLQADRKSVSGLAEAYGNIQVGRPRRTVRNLPESVPYTFNSHLIKSTIPKTKLDAGALKVRLPPIYREMLPPSRLVKVHNRLEIAKSKKPLLTMSPGKLSRLRKSAMKTTTRYESN